MTITDLKPNAVWKNFSLLNAIPRASKKEEKAATFVADFATRLGLQVLRDDAGNVVVKKPAQGSGAGKAPVILQAHLDMVHQKNGDTTFDFDTQGIEMYVDGEWVKARGTTLGADNGMGVAYILTLLEDKTLDHPPLEALFTIDEEAGMTGAKNLGAGLLESKILLNLDTEDENEITIGCAGGIDTNVTMNLAFENVPANSKGYVIGIKGLKGGHSGVDIHLGRGNANKLLFRMFIKTNENFGLRIAAVDGGGLRNAIPREAFATITVDAAKASDFEKYIQDCIVTIHAEYSTTDENMQITLEPAALPAQVLETGIQEKLIATIFTVPNGVFRMSTDIPGLVETSSNLARVLVKDGKFLCQSLQRSSVEEAKAEIASKVRSAFEDMGAHVEHAGEYPGWKPEPDSELLKKGVSIYKEVFGKEPNVLACHAGLECGIINGRYPGLDMISIGPTIKHPHSPDEKVHIESVERFWNYLLALLKSF